MFPALAGLLAGTAAQLQQAQLLPWQADAAVALVALAIGALALRGTAALRWRMGAAVLAGAALAFALTGLRATAFLHDALAPGLEGRDLSVVGVVAAMPQRNEAGLRFRFEVESAQWQDQPVRLPPSIYLGWYSNQFGDVPADAGAQPAALMAGERWQMTVRLKAPHGASNPFGFDYELWLWEQGLQANGYVRAGASDAPPQRLAQTGAHPVERARQRVRDRIFDTVAARPYAGLIAALLVGDQNAIERADWDVFRATGVAHLMSISGLHITMFAWVATLLVGWCWRRSTRLCLWLVASSAALFGGMLMAGAYAFFSGWGVPAQRTVLMLCCVALLRLSGKRWPWPQVWLLACAAVLAIDPWAMLQAGFWLSFVAVGVLFATDAGRLRERAGHTQAAPHWRVAAALWARARAMAREQWLITLALTPLTLLLFGQVSLVGLVANALAIPWVTLLITPLTMLGVLAPPLWELAALAIAALSGYLQWLAGLPLASVVVAQAPLWAGVAGVAGGLLLALQLPWSLRLLGVPLMLPVLLWQSPAPPAGQFELLAADIGQGNAVLVRTANHALLYDAGPRYSRDSDAGHRVLLPLLRALNLPLDVLLLSHRDSDHTGGALAVLGMQGQAELISSIEDDHELQALRSTTRCMAGQHWRWDGVDFAVLHPRASDYDVALKSNAMSCVLRVSNAAQAALLAGDIEQAQEARLVADLPAGAAGLRADVLLVPHHGSKSSSGAALLDAVQPRIALVQAGYRNRFGHPAPQTLEHYRERHIQVHDSPHCGAASWRSAQPATVACQRAQALRYWHHRLP